MALIEHLEKLRHFHKLTQYSSINETAVNTGVSQAGLSKSLILLENELGCKLFNRSRAGLTLTKQGRQVLHVTKNILSQAGELENCLRSMKAVAVPKKIRIGMYDSIAVYFGIELQRYLKSVYPNVTMILHADSSSILLNKLKTDQIDIALGVNFKNQIGINYEYLPIFEDYFSLYTIPDITDRIAELPVIIHQNATDTNGKTLEKMLNLEIRKNGVHYVQNFETLKTLTFQGFGIGVLPSQVAKPLVNKGQLIQIQSNKQSQVLGKHEIGFLVKKDTQNSFQDFVSDIYRMGKRWSIM